MLNKKDSIDECNKDKNHDKPEAQSTSTKLTKKDGAVIGDNNDTKDKANVNKTKKFSRNKKKKIKTKK